jgi:Na+(H+)/acetate symporter ActP
MASFFNQLIQGTSSLLIFFLILAGNYEGFIFSCEFREKLLKNVWMKHVIGFGILYVFVVQFASSEKSIPRNLLISLVLYIWFFLLMRLPLALTLLNIGTLFVLYLLQESKAMHKDKPEEQKLINRITTIQIVILCLAFVLTIAGVPYKLYRDNVKWSFAEFVKGVPDKKCLDSPTTTSRSASRSGGSKSLL